MKTTELIQLHKFVMVVAIGAVLSVTAFGQQLGKVAKMQQANSEALREYTWKTRTEIKKDGETKIIRLDQVRYAVDGGLQQTQLSLTAPEIPTGGLRGKIARKKKAQFTELVDGLKAVAKSYGKLPPEKMARLMESASITLVDTAGGKLLRVNGTDILQSGDSMTIWIDPILQRQRKIEVMTTFEGNTLRVISEFRDIVGGPSYLARVAIDYPEEKLLITTDNFDHSRQEAIGGAGTR
jgi:hypothetical protein